MAKYRVYGVGYFTTPCVEIEADSEDEAMEKGGDNIGAPSLCWHCSREIEADCVDEIRAEKV